MSDKIIKTKTKTRKIPTGTIVALSIMAGVFALLSVLYGISLTRANAYANSLENIYQMSFYDLVDNVNNAEIKLSKVLASGDNAYSKKLLSEVSVNTARATENINTLPVSPNGLQETINFLNKANGYTISVVNSLENGQDLSLEQLETLTLIYDAISNIKQNLNKMSLRMWEGYSILETSLDIDGDYNNFTGNIGDGNNSIEYPSMIYDGPFADSVINATVKGLTGNEVSKDIAIENAKRIFENIDSDNIEYLGETSSKFTTHDFSIKTLDGQQLFIQMTKIEGKLLTVSSYSDNISTNITLENAISIAENFAEKAGIMNVECVWSDIVGGACFVNLAPVENGVILYPDLVKVKVNLSTGEILGFEASEYYTNHVDRTIEQASYDAVSAKNKISNDFTIHHQKLALTPLDYNKQLLCYEFKCSKMGATYYIYINAMTGACENVLKVIETDNGNLLM